MIRIEASLLTRELEHDLQDELAILDGLSETHKIPLTKPFALLSSAWVLSKLPRLELTVIELGAPASLLALALADRGDHVAVVNEKFFGEFLTPATQKGITVFPRPVHIPWSRFFHKIADAVICFDVDELQEHTVEQAVRHLLVPVRHKSKAFVTAKVQLTAEAKMGIPVDVLADSLVALDEHGDIVELYGETPVQVVPGVGCALIEITKQ